MSSSVAGDWRTVKIKIDPDAAMSVCCFGSCRRLTLLPGGLQSVEMLKNIVAFHQLAISAVERTAGGGADGQKVTFNVIRQRLGDLMYKITSQKFEDPEEGEEAIKCALFRDESAFVGTAHTVFAIRYKSSKC